MVRRYPLANGDREGEISQMSTTAKSLPATVTAYVGVVLLTFVWRVLAIPRDFGGCILQFWIAVAGVLFFGKLFPRLNVGGRRVAQWVLLPVATLLMLGTVYFAPQALFPFLFVALIVVGALYSWSTSRTTQALLLSLLLVPLGVFCVYGYQRMALATRLRSLQTSDVAETRFAPLSENTTDIVVDKPEALEIIVASLKGTYPYSPNHEGIERPWRVTVAMQDGSSVEFEMGHGNRAHPSFAWLQFGVEVYQDPQLCHALAAAGVRPWD